MNRTIALLLGASLVGVVSCVADPEAPGKLTDCSLGATPGGRLDMPVGGVRVFGTAQSIGCEIVPTTPNAEYLFVVSNASSKLDDEKRFTFVAGPDTTQALATSASLAISPALVADRSGGLESDRVSQQLGAQSEQELAIRSYEREHLRPAGALARLAAERAQLAAAGPKGIRGALVAGAVPAVGDTLPFRVPGMTKPCDTFASVNSVVKYVGTRAIILQDVAAPANGFTDADFQAIANEFDTLIYPTDVSYFGAASDVDGNGGHIYILLTPEINKLNPRSSSSSAGIFAGFFFAGDYFPRTGTGACNQSNGAEVFYLLVPDPSGVFSTAVPAWRARELTSGTVAHEFQHMINAGIRFAHPTAQFETVWLDEGLAHLAEEVVGRASDGYGDLQPLTFADVSVSASHYKAYYDQNLRRFALWLAHPDTSSAISVHADANLSSRGAAWALVRYGSEKYSGGDARAWTRALVAGPDTGVTNLTLRSHVPLDTILAGYQVANYADDLGIAGLSQAYSYTSWNMRDAVGRAVGTSAASYPLLVNQLPTSGGSIPGETRTAAATFVRYVGTTSTPPLVARLVNEAKTALATYAGARLYVLRVR